MSDAPPSAADLMLDLLAAADGGRLTVQDLCRGGAAMGLGEAVVRVALTRLGQQNKIRKVDRGAYTIHPARRSLQEDVEHWLDRLNWMVTWRGRWIAVHDPELARLSKTQLRHHRRALALRGFRTWTPGLHLRPDNLRGGVQAMRAQLYDLGLVENTPVFVASQLTEAQTQAVMKLWDVGALQANYTDLLKQLNASEKGLRKLDDLAAARECLLLGRHVISQIVRDPLLPKEMMGGSERQVLIERTQAYQTRSKAIWARVLNPAA